MAVIYGPYATSNANINYRIVATVSNANASTKTATLTVELQFKNIKNWDGSYWCQGLPNEYTLTVNGTVVGSTSDWSLSGINADFKTLLTNTKTVSIEDNGNISYTFAAASSGSPTLGSFNTGTQSQTISSGLSYYTITLNPNSGSVSVASPARSTTTNNITITVLAGTSIQGIAGSKTGYSCKGWYNAASGGTKILDNNGSLNNISINRTLYAQWENNTFSITLNPNGGSFTSSENTIASSSAKTFTKTYGSSITSVNGVRNGYTCKGWYTAASGGTRILANNGSLTNIGKSWTLYAQWTQDEQQVDIDDPYDIVIKEDGNWINGHTWIKVNETWTQAVCVWVKISGIWMPCKYRN